MSAGPLPAKRAFLSDLPKLPLDSKARFLGWYAHTSSLPSFYVLLTQEPSVTNYQSQTGILTLEHHYPSTSPTPASVSVDITLLIESIKASYLEVGEWLNVLGYVRERKEKRKGRNQATCSPESQAWNDSIYIEAVVVFPTDAFQIGEYERALQDWIDVDRMIKRAG